MTKGKPARLAIQILLRAEWRVGRKTIVHEAITETIDADGAVLKIMHDERPVDRVLLENVGNSQVLPAKVIAVTPTGGKSPRAYLLRVKFDSPSPAFWARAYFYGKAGLDVVYIPESVLLNQA